MKVLRVCLILFLLQLGALFLATSCCEELYTYQWSDLSLTHIDNRGAEPIEASDNRLSAIAYALRVHMGFDFVYQQPCFKGFINSAYATSCLETYSTNDTIVGISVFPLSDFDENHLSGTSLEDYFAAKRRNSVTTYSSLEEKLAQAVPIADFLEQINEQAEYDLFTDFDLLLLKEPTLDSVFQFVVEVELSSSAVLRDTTESIVLY
ncbi:MAG: DUF5034 domain-containing protein [Chitinophagales bacterium]